MTDTLTRRSTHVVWELTLACNLACGHCGSRAGKARAHELSALEALEVVRRLDAAGVKEVTLIGGEAYLRADWAAIARAVSDAGMVCSMVTGGRGLTAPMAARIRDAGIASVSVSLDGLEATHDALRGVSGSWRSALGALTHLGEAGVATSVNTQINRRSLPELEAIYALAAAHGVHSWQVQLTVPMGRAADDPALLLQPYELLELFPRLATIAEQAKADDIRLHPGNNVGYFGPYEALLRGDGDPDAHWMGCQAGIQVLGLESDGTLKACPSLPTAAYAGGNILDGPLEPRLDSQPALSFNRELLVAPERVKDALWGFCGGCYYGSVCRGGCNWTAHVILGRRGNNPYCHHRALQLAAEGLRERLVPVAQAPGSPYDHGLFELVVEPAPA